MLSIAIVLAMGSIRRRSGGQSHHILELYRSKVADRLMDLPDKMLSIGILRSVGIIGHHKAIGSVSSVSKSIGVGNSVHALDFFLIQCNTVHRQIHPAYVIDKGEVVGIAQIGSSLSDYVNHAASCVEEVEDIVLDNAKIYLSTICHEIHERNSPWMTCIGGS